MIQIHRPPVVLWGIFRRSLNVGLLCSLELVCPAGLQGQQEPAGGQATSDSDSIKELVEQLGDDKFEVRRQAAQRLARLGVTAQAALQAGLKHEDIEIRRQCRRLLVDVLDAAYQKSLADFIARHEDQNNEDPSSEPDFDEGPPGWRRYREMVGDGQSARQLFIEMHQAEGPLLCAMESGGVAAAKTIAVRFEQAYSSPTRSRVSSTRRLTWPMAAAYLFAASDPRLPQTTSPSSLINWSSVLRQKSFQQAMTGAATKALASKILARWVAHARYLAPVERRLYWTWKHNLNEGLELAIASLSNRSIPPTYRVYAIHVVGKLGGKEQAWRLLSLLNDKQVCYQSRVLRNGERLLKTTQIRDVALAWLVHLTGQKHADYGMARIAATFSRINRSTSISTVRMAFTTEKERQAAFEKWADYIKQHPLQRPAGE